MSDRHLELIARALAHAEAHLDEVLTADRLADRAAMSRYHFHRVFRAYMGHSLANYVTSLRLRRACALLVSGREPVSEIAVAVGYESAQALAKALRRDLGTTPTTVRRGGAPESMNAHRCRNEPRIWPAISEGTLPMQVSRFTVLPEGIVALTATARGMVNNNLMRAAQQAFAELMQAASRAGVRERVASYLSVALDEPDGPDDPHCRFVAGVVFGYELATSSGRCEHIADIPLSGTLAWQAIAGGRYAVFTHLGPFTTLHQTWKSIYRDWLPDSGEQLRDAPPMELNLNRLATTPPDELRTEIWIPLA